MNNNNIGFLLHNVSTIIDRHSDQVLMERLGVGFAQFKILLVLSEKDGSTQNQIAIRLGQTEASISRQVKLMAKEGLISVRRSTSNRRVRLIFLTDKGYLTVERSINALNDYYEPMFGVLRDQDREVLAKILIKLKSYF
jgi:DNA-binding MarR family transcriptional regulator